MHTAYVEQLTLHAVRSYTELSLPLEPGILLLTGSNGVGKTNLLEAVAVVAAGTSPRTSTDRRLIREGCDTARIAAQVCINKVAQERAVLIPSATQKRLSVNGTSIRTTDEFAATLPTVTFLPEKLLTIRGAPLRRRAMIDLLARHVIPTAAATQREYHHALQQRNTLLRRVKHATLASGELEPWDALLVEHGSTLRHTREQLLELLAPAYHERFEQLTGLTSAAFQVDLRGSGDLACDIQTNTQAEHRRGTTLVGPHLDDIRPRVGARDLRTLGSTGEQRVALLAFTLAARDLLADATKISPIVLLDEPWSELDTHRRRRLTTALTTLGQVVVTTTEAPQHVARLAPQTHLFTVSYGEVTACPLHPPAPTSSSAQ